MIFLPYNENIATSNFCHPVRSSHNQSPLRHHSCLNTSSFSRQTERHHVDVMNNIFSISKSSWHSNRRMIRALYCVDECTLLFKPYPTVYNNSQKGSPYSTFTPSIKYTTHRQLSYRSSNDISIRLVSLSIDL